MFYIHSYKRVSSFLLIGTNLKKFVLSGLISDQLSYFPIFLSKKRKKKPFMLVSFSLRFMDWLLRNGGSVIWVKLAMVFFRSVTALSRLRSRVVSDIIRFDVHLMDEFNLDYYWLTIMLQTQQSNISNSVRWLQIQSSSDLVLSLLLSIFKYMLFTLPNMYFFSFNQYCRSTSYWVLTLLFLLALPISWLCKRESISNIFLLTDI